METLTRSYTQLDRARKLVRLREKYRKKEPGLPSLTLIEAISLVRDVDKTPSYRP